MTRLGRLVLVLAVIAVVTPAARAERQRGPGFGRGSLFVLTQKSVQDEVKLSEEQVQKIKELSEKQLGLFKELAQSEPGGQAKKGRGTDQGQ